MKFLKNFEKKLRLVLIMVLILFPANFIQVHTNKIAEASSQAPDPSLKPSKFLFMYKYPLVQNEPNHKLNVFTYKNVLFSNDQIVYFASSNEADPV